MSNRTELFISYSHADTKWLKLIQTHLEGGMKAGSMPPVGVWSDLNLAPGSQWREEIFRAMSRAKVAVLLVSADFLASDFIMDYEVPTFVSAADRGELKVLWVPVRPCLYEYTVLGRFQALCNPETPLSSMDKGTRETALVTVCRGIRSALEAL